MLKIIDYSFTPNTLKKTFQADVNKRPIQLYFHNQGKIEKNIKRLRINKGIRKLLKFDKIEQRHFKNSFSTTMRHSKYRKNS